MKMIRIDNFVVGGICFCSFFPWISLGFLNFGSDIQIYPTLILVALLPVVFTALTVKGYNWKYRNKRLYTGIILFLIGASLIIVSILVVDGINYDALRGIYPYLSAIVWTLFACCICRYYPAVVKKYVYLAMILWLAVAFIQFFIDKHFLSALLRRTVITDDRGVISLGSEPAYFAMTLLAFAFVLFIYEKKKSALALVFLLIILSKSTAVIIPLLLCIAFLLFIPYLFQGQRRIYKIFLFLLMLLLASTLFFVLTSGKINIATDESSSRFYKLLSTIASFDIYSILIDGSFNIRLTHYAASLTGFFSNLGFPNGINSWPLFVSDYALHSHVFWNDGLNETNRINSGLGTLLFEGGIFGLIMFIGIYYILTFYNPAPLKKILVLVTLFIMLMCVYSIKIPYLYIVVMLYVDKCLQEQ